MGAACTSTNHPRRLPARAAEYYRRLEAPRKAWVWFERSSHTPWVSEFERFVDVLTGQFLEEPRSGR
jgi:hypothetical protein